MTQSSRPETFTSTSWTGTAANLADESDGTYNESPMDPTAAQEFTANLTDVSDPGAHTGHIIKVRANVYPSGFGTKDLVLKLENIDDDSIVATKTYASVPDDGYVDEELTLTEGEAALIHDYGNLRVRGTAA